MIHDIYSLISNFPRRHFGSRTILFQISLCSVVFLSLTAIGRAWGPLELATFGVTGVSWHLLIPINSTGSTPKWNLHLKRLAFVAACLGITLSTGPGPKRGSPNANTPSPWRATASAQLASVRGELSAQIEEYAELQKKTKWRRLLWAGCLPNRDCSLHTGVARPPQWAISLQHCTWRTSFSSKGIQNRQSWQKHLGKD